MVIGAIMLLIGALALVRHRIRYEIFLYTHRLTIVLAIVCVVHTFDVACAEVHVSGRALTLVSHQP